ncbi:hypothetical protein PROFUN_02502 [Planoprotostelium fungivorum]|uniref:Zinc/iron permease n=1 Tax=Planoprotostelium fungivorum TaxID=1890364 RepID=A0A2P6MP56_9EUKA|nr:hypothetical protein PROFUN_02502 [Planoprotostelium fungivorum]
MQGGFWSAIALTTISGLSTSIGGAVVLMGGNPSTRSLGHMLSFASGVMLEISFIDMLPEAVSSIGFFEANLYFFVGMLLCGSMVYLIPEEDLSKLAGGKTKDQEKEGSLLRAGMITALGISLHNFPEGIAVYLSCLRGIGMGLPLAIAISIHNIPEGMAVAVPIYAATKDRWQAFKWCTLSGLCEPVGALIAGVFLTSILTEHMVQCSLAMVAGVMVFLCLKELLPTTLKYIDAGEAVISHMVGMFIIFISVHLLSDISGGQI